MPRRLLTNVLLKHCKLLTISILYIFYILCILTSNVLIKLITTHKNKLAGDSYTYVTVTP